MSLNPPPTWHSILWWKGFDENFSDQGRLELKMVAGYSKSRSKIIAKFLSLSLFPSMLWLDDYLPIFSLSMSQFNLCNPTSWCLYLYHLSFNGFNFFKYCFFCTILNCFCLFLSILTVCLNYYVTFFFKKKWAIPGLFFFIFVFSIHSWQYTNVQYY